MTSFFERTILVIRFTQAACKTVAVALAVAIILSNSAACLGRKSTLWAMAPIALLVLLDAACVRQYTRYLGLLRREADNAGGITDLEEPVIRTCLSMARAIFSLSILPFYLALFTILLMGVIGSPKKEPAPPSRFSDPPATPAHSGQTPTLSVRTPALVPGSFRPASPLHVNSPSPTDKAARHIPPTPPQGPIDIKPQ
jgi:hypothetical protein